MKKYVFLFAVLSFLGRANAQNVGIGTSTPVSKLNIIGPSGVPAIPGATSTGIFRIGVNSVEGIDFGKLNTSPFTAWIQSGFNGTTPDPLSLQPAGGNVAIGTITPALTAVLDITSTAKGFLPPRMTIAQRNAISSPALGLMIFCTTCGGGEIEVYSGIDWRNMIGVPATPFLTIGESYGGGIVAFILQTGDPGYIAGQVHGLIAAVSDQSSGSWGCFGTNLPGAQGIILGTGQQNTIDIVTGCSTAGIAARTCYDLVLEGYNDWYLPSKDELSILYINRVAIGGFANSFYWSSSEVDLNNAWVLTFNGGFTFNGTKSLSEKVRAIRSF